jgi:hypothetical protein
MLFFSGGGGGGLKTAFRVRVGAGFGRCYISC